MLMDLPSFHFRKFNFSTNFFEQVLLKYEHPKYSGKPSIVTGESAKMVAGINATALFFAPLIRTVPFKDIRLQLLIFP